MGVGRKGRRGGGGGGWCQKLKRWLIGLARWLKLDGIGGRLD